MSLALRRAISLLGRTVRVLEEATVGVNGPWSSMASGTGDRGLGVSEARDGPVVVCAVCVAWEHVAPQSTCGAGGGNAGVQVCAEERAGVFSPVSSMSL